MADSNDDRSSELDMGGTLLPAGVIPPSLLNASPLGTDGVSPSSIDDLFVQLDNDLRQKQYEQWSDRIKEVLSSQFRGYISSLKEIEKNLKKDGFEEKFERITGTIHHIGLESLRNIYYHGGDTTEIVEKLLAKFQSYEPDLSPLERSISSLKGDIKFDSLTEGDRERITSIFEEQDVHTAVYHYLVRELGDKKLADSAASSNEGYTTCLRKYLKSMEELNQVAEELKEHSGLYPGWFSRRHVEKKWVGNLDLLLYKLQTKHLEVGRNYSCLENSARQYRRIHFPTGIQEIPELYGTLEELEAKDPESTITAKKGSDGTYTISMEPTKDYVMIHPFLVLSGGYQPQSGTEAEVNIDLTEGIQGDIFSNEVVQSNDKKVEAKLKVNLGDMPKDLRLNGSYELPYLKRKMEVGGLILIAEMVSSGQ